MIELKDKVLLTEASKSVWRRNQNSTEWMDANKLYRFLFGVSLGNSNCECIEDLFHFIKKNNINQKILNKMEIKEFILIPGKVLQTYKFGLITEATSEDTLKRLLHAFPTNSRHFKKLPEDWQTVCADFVNGKTKKTADKAENVDNVDKSDSVDLDSMKVPALKDYIESKGFEVPDGKKAVILEFAKTL